MCNAINVLLQFGVTPSEGCCTFMSMQRGSCPMTLRNVHIDQLGGDIQMLGIGELSSIKNERRPLCRRRQLGADKCVDMRGGE